MTVQYQPRVSLRNGAVTGFEVSHGALREACEQMAESAELLIVPTGLQSLLSLATDVRQTLTATGLAPERLRLAIPELAIMAPDARFRAALHHLRDMGVGLEIDHFGTGRFPVNYLRALPFNGLKIDRSFIHALGTSNDSSEIIALILKFVESLGISVIADGVETEQQYLTLKKLGCTAAQGLWFSAAQLHVVN